MKLARLLLHAFGPFTDTEIDFTAGGAASNLHLIYGPNEAGKSSTLRAMTDLRFGIPLRSPDDFLHPSKDLRIAGIFVDAIGESVGLVRRKGRNSTLSVFDPATGDLTSAVEAGREHEIALTGGLSRDEFEAMFGLNHLRLREGGDRLLKGEGELGSALFEASAGTRGITAILSSLDEDAKKLFGSRSKNAVVNEARRQFDEYRKVWKEAQTRPADWQALNRAHEQARETLAEIDRNMEAARRRENELTELRTVAPLLREYDQVLAELRELADVPNLPEDAREKRLAAEQALKRAESDLQEALHDLERLSEALGSLVIETPLLEHAETIERLVSGLDSVGRSRIEVRQHQVTFAQLGDEISALSSRIAPGRGMDAILAALPSDAERAALTDHFAEIPRLNERLAGYRDRIEALDKAAGSETENSFVLPEPGARQRLLAALRHAQSSGNASQHLDDLERDITALAEERAQALSDLGSDGINVLRQARPLLDAQIESARATLAELDGAADKLVDETRRLEADLAQQQLRKQQLAAVGEIVTAETLRLARERRDTGWRLVRQVYVDRNPDSVLPDMDKPLPEAFETAQENADRQADLLRADAARAANFEDCLARIEQMEVRKQTIAEQLTGIATKREAALRDWSCQLAEAGLPSLEPDALWEWQTARGTLLELDGRVQRLNSDRDRLAGKVAEAAKALAGALSGVGETPQEATLALLVEQAVRWESETTALIAKNEERGKALAARRLERQKLDEQIARTEAERQSHLDAVDAWNGRLFLPTGSGPGSVKAQLAELDALERKLREQREVHLRQSRQQAVIAEFEQQAENLARLLREPIPESAEDFAARLQMRLKVTREQEQERIRLTRDRSRAEQSGRNAGAEQAKQKALLEQLCAVAGVENLTQLAECEERASRKRHAESALTMQRRQLAQASVRSEAELRERLSDQDVVAIEAERERCRETIDRLEREQVVARGQEEETRRAVEAIDSSDGAAKAREAMESAAARVQGAVRPWIRLRLAHALLQQSLKRFRERAQAPMVAVASTYFSVMTGGRYRRLSADETDERPVLRAERQDGGIIGVEAMSEGTADQLYLALRLAALELRRDSQPQMPLVLDDVLITSDEARAANILRALARFAAGGQVMLFTHHHHLIDLARGVLHQQDFAIHTLGQPSSESVSLEDGAEGTKRYNYK